MPKAVVTITSKDEMSQGLNQAKKSVMQFQQGLDKVGAALSKAFKITSITAGIVALGKSLTDCVKAFEEADRVSRRLSAVWENVGAATGKSARQMDDLAEALEKESFFTSEAIKEAGLLLAATESLTEEGFDRALGASLDLATAMGTDVTAAAQTMAKALIAPDEAFKSLKTVGVAFTDAEKDQIKTLIENNEQLEAQDLILSKIEEKYKGVSKAISDTPASKLKQIRDTLGDLRETIGQGIVDTLSPAFKFILDNLKKITHWAKEHMDEKHFWSDADTGNSHKLFSSYSADFLEEKKGESQSMISEQMSRLADTDWGRVIREQAHWSMEQLLSKDRQLIQSIAEFAAGKAYGENFEDHIGTVEGFMEMIADQYDPLLLQLNTIEGALEEYANAPKVDTPDFGENNGSSSSGVVVEGNVIEPSELEKVLSKYGKMSIKWQMADLQKQIDSIKYVYGDASLEEQSYLNQILGALFEQKAILEGKGEGGSSEGSSSGPELVVDEKTKAFQDSVFSSLFANLGEVGSAMSSLTSNIMTMGPALGTLMTGLEYVMQGFGAALAPFVDVLTTTILEPLVEVGKAIGTLVLPVLQLLTPVLNLFANIVLTITGTFQYIGQLLQHWVATVLNWLASIDLLGWRPFAGLATNDPGAPGSLSTYLTNYKKGILGSTGAADSEATKQAVSSASYRGSTNVTINIYQEAPVVGDNGMRQFAQMIRDEFEALDYYGVTA